MGDREDKGHAELFEAIFASALDGIIAIDEVGTVQSFNPAAERLFGYTAVEVVGQNVRMLMPSPDRERHDGYLHNYRVSGQAKILGLGREVTARHKNGDRIPIHLALSEAVVGAGRLFVGTCRDIRELVRARAEVEAARARNDAVLDTAVDAILTIDAVGIVQSFNPAAERLFGFSRLEILGKNVKTLMPSSVAVHHDGYLEHTLRTGERKIIGTGREVVAQRKDGTCFPAWLSVSHFRVNQGDFFTGIVRNITELREKEEELTRVNTELARNAHLSAQQLELNNVVRGTTQLTEALHASLRSIAQQTDALMGAGYIEDEETPGAFVLCAAVSLTADNVGRRVRLGEGFIGEALRHSHFRMVDLGESTLVAHTAFGEVKPRYVGLIPLVHQDVVIGGFELGYASKPKPAVVEYLATLASLGGALLGTSRDQNRIARLLVQARAQATAMQTANDQLDQRAQELQAQQEELEASNEQLEVQKARLELVNEELEHSRADLAEKAQALETTSRYKSEFLANMSHELRTPLNSILILAKVLAENRGKNLSVDQVESLGVIASSGTDLLTLVNDILDLSKIEAGKLQLTLEDVTVGSVVEGLERQFLALMKAKGLDFRCEIEAGVPELIHTDRVRLEQVLRNLLSNAHKFTETGGVRLTVKLASDQPIGTEPGLVFEVADTGIGIPKDKQGLIFQPFQQVDAGLSRKFGGTGLGLSISSNLAEGLGGRLEVESELGSGSVFRLLLSLGHWSVLATPRTEPPMPGERIGEAPGDASGDDETPTILIVEDDPAAQLALKHLIESRGLSVRVANTVSEAKAVFRARPIKGVILDLGLGSGSGAELARWIRGTGKSAPPVIIHTGRTLSETEERELRELAQAVIIKGDRAYERLLDEVKLLLHRTTRHVSTAPARHRDEVFLNRRVLVVDDDVRNIFALRALLGAAGMTVYVAEDGQEALNVFSEVPNLDCILMDLMMPGMNGLEATRRLRRMNGGAEVPIIALTAKAMKEDRQACLDAGASDYMSKPVNNDELMGLMRVWMTR